MSSSQYDVVVFGATSFVGKLVAKYFLEMHGAKPREFKWAVSARSQKKLDALRKELGAEVPQIVADASDEASLRTMVKQSKVIITLVGPYAKYGEKLVKVAAEEGVHVLDLTGETLYVKKMIDLYHETAVKSGAKIIPSCGFDSIPADVGTYMVAEYLRRVHNCGASEVSYYMGSAKGGVSGGTVASVLEVAAQVWRGGMKTIKQMSDPYLLCPSDSVPDYPNPGAGGGFAYDPNLPGWSAPFICGGHDTKLVHRSNALLQGWYGRLRYREVIPCKGRVLGFFKAAIITAITYVVMVIVLLPPTRALLERFVVPKPGTGPSKQDRDSGFFTVNLLGKSSDRSITVRGTVGSDKGDAGYNETAKMISECALTLVLDANKLASKDGGVVTTATLGTPLIERLRARGMTFTVTEDKGTARAAKAVAAKFD